jgi:hypothetical protein
MAVEWLLEQVFPAWAFMLQFQTTHDGRLPALSECPFPFVNVSGSRNGSASPFDFQLRLPQMLLTGAKKWHAVLIAVKKRRRNWAKLFSRVVVAESGFVGDLSKTMSKSRLMLAPNMLNGTGIATKVMTGLQRGVPVVANAHAAVGYNCNILPPDLVHPTDDQLTVGKLSNCPHLLVTGPITAEERARDDPRVAAYWYARGALLLFQSELRWTDQAQAGLRFVQERRTLKEWNGILGSVLGG